MTTSFELMLALPLDELKKRIQSKEKQIQSIQRDLDFMRRAHEQKVRRQMTQEVLQAIADIQKRRVTSNMLAREEKFHDSHHN